MTSQHNKPPLEPFKYARNGKYPDSLFQADLAGLANHIALFHMKEVASFIGGSLSSPDSSDRLRWRTRYRASQDVVAVVARCTLGLTEQTLGEFETEQAAHVVIEFYDGATLQSAASLYYGNSTAESVNPDDLAVLSTFLNWDPGVAPLGQTIWQPVGGDLYDLLVTDVQSNITSLTLFEVCLNEPGPFEEGYAVGTPILDNQREELVEWARVAWKQAAPLFTWTVDQQATPRSQTTGAVKNIFDDTSTTVTAAKPGLTLDLRFRNRVSEATVPCEIHAYGSCTDTGFVYLKDSGGATVGYVEINSATPGWFTGTADLPPTLAKYDLHYGDQPADETLEISAVCLMQYQTGA